MPVKVVRAVKPTQAMKQLHRMKLCTQSCFICRANKEKAMQTQANKERK